MLEVGNSMWWHNQFLAGKYWCHFIGYRPWGESYQCLKSSLSPTSEDGQNNPAAIWLTPTLHCDRQSASSLLTPTFTLSSSTCFFNVPFGLSFFLWPSTSLSNALLKTWLSSLLNTWPIWHRWKHNFLRFFCLLQVDISTCVLSYMFTSVWPLRWLTADKCNGDCIGSGPLVLLGRVQRSIHWWHRVVGCCVGNATALAVM